MNVVSVTVEGITFKVAPTPLAKMAQAKAALGGLVAGEWNEDTMTALVTAVFWGAKRAGEALTLDWLLMNVDLTNYTQLFEAFVSVNELKGKPAGEAEGVVAPVAEG